MPQRVIEQILQTIQITPALNCDERDPFPTPNILIIPKFIPYSFRAVATFLEQQMTQQLFLRQVNVLCVSYIYDKEALFHVFTFTSHSGYTADEELVLYTDNVYDELRAIYARFCQLLDNATTV